MDSIFTSIFFFARFSSVFSSVKKDYKIFFSLSHESRDLISCHRSLVIIHSPIASSSTPSPPRPLKKLQRRPPTPRRAQRWGGEAESLKRHSPSRRPGPLENGEGATHPGRV